MTSRDASSPLAFPSRDLELAVGARKLVDAVDSVPLRKQLSRGWWNVSESRLGGGPSCSINSDAMERVRNVGRMLQGGVHPFRRV